jgi:hypothetical protein
MDYSLGMRFRRSIAQAFGMEIMATYLLELLIEVVSLVQLCRWGKI